MPERYWLVHPNGGRQLIDPRQFDLEHLAEKARRLGGHLVVERRDESFGPTPPAPASVRFEPPTSALGPLFQGRLDAIYGCQTPFTIDMNARPTVRVLGGYYKKRRLVRVYTHDRQTGRRSLEELFDTFLHEVAHHIEYTEPHVFAAPACGRVPGRMHSRLFWRILGELKGRWNDRQHRGDGRIIPPARGERGPDSAGRDSDDEALTPARPETPDARRHSRPRN